MALTLYKEPDFQGVYARLGPGTHRELTGCPHQSLACEDLDNAASSMRVEARTVAFLSDGRAPSARGGRVFIGPAEVPDLAAVGLGGKVSSVLVVPFRAWEAALPPIAGVTLYDGYGATGRRSVLRRGDYSRARLASEEVRMPGDRAVSMTVDEDVVAVLYVGENFESGGDAAAVVGPAEVEDLERLGLAGRVGSVRVLVGEPAPAVWASPAVLLRAPAALPQPPARREPPARRKPPAPPTVIVMERPPKKTGLHLAAAAAIAAAVAALAAIAALAARPRRRAPFSRGPPAGLP